MKGILINIRVHNKFLQKYYIVFKYFIKYQTFDDMCKNALCDSLQSYTTVLAQLSVFL